MYSVVGSILIFTTMVGSRTILEKMESLWVSFLFFWEES